MAPFRGEVPFLGVVDLPLDPPWAVPFLGVVDLPLDPPLDVPLAVPFLVLVVPSYGVEAFQEVGPFRVAYPAFRVEVQAFLASYS